MEKAFLADTDKENIKKLTCLMKKTQFIQPEVWQGLESCKSFIEALETGVLFVRIDDPSLPGLELTRLAAEYYPVIYTVWMAENESYALEAFPRGATAFLLLPATAEKLQNVEKSIACYR